MTVPVWGCPWHGPVQGGQLTLPNAATKAYPQPAGLSVSGQGPVPDRYGETHRLAVPGVPVVERTSEEQAADAAAGWQWRNEAILSGAQQELFGRALAGWIYVAPDGSRWRVQCVALNENTDHTIGPITLTVTLSRFGDFGKAAEQYSYAVSLTDWGTAYGAAPTKARLMIDAIKPDGSAAIVMVHERQIAQLQIRWPHAFLELTISGHAASAVVSIAVVRNRAQVLQVSRSGPQGEYYLVGWRRFYQADKNYSEPFAVVHLTGEGGNSYLTQYQVIVNGSMIEQGVSRECLVVNGTANLESRRLLALWYAADGQLVEVALTYDLQVVYNWPLPTDGVRDCSLSASWVASIEVGGVPVVTITGSQSGTSHEVYRNPLRKAGEPWPTTSEAQSVGDITVDGSSTHAESTDPAPNQSWIAADRNTTPWMGDIFPAVKRSTAGDFVVGKTAAQLAEDAYQTGFGSTTTFSVIRYANHVIGMRAYRAAAAAYAYHPPATPSGPASGGIVLSASTPNRYGSWCPYTHASQWHISSPVCYV